jgi:hypothetical protein
MAPSSQGRFDRGVEQVIAEQQQKSAGTAEPYPVGAVEIHSDRRNMPMAPGALRGAVSHVATSI